MVYCQLDDPSLPITFMITKGINYRWTNELFLSEQELLRCVETTKRSKGEKSNPKIEKGF